MQDKRIIIGAVIAAALLLGLLVWYMATHPAPVYAPTTGVATSSNTGSALGPGQVADSGPYYAIEGIYPNSTVLKQTASLAADAQAVGVMRAFVEGQAAEFKQQNVGNLTAEDIREQELGGDRKYTLDIEYQTYQSSYTVSYLFQLYADTMGAHPNTYYRSFTFDKKTGKELELANLFKPGADYLGRLSTISRAELPSIIAERTQQAVSDVDTDDIKDGTKPEAASFQTFYLDGTNFVLFFPPYQIGPYVLGTTALPIPLSELDDVLKAEYHP